MAYATVADARAEGVPVAISDGRIQDALDLYAQFIDRATRQWFEPRDDITIDLDGNDGNILFLPVPVISLDELYLNGDMDNVVDVANYRVYNGRTALKDDRKNPKIQLVMSSMSIYDTPLIRGNMPAFLQGTKNQRLVGTFGYTEEDDTTPLLIKRANLKLAISKLRMSPTGLWQEVAESSGGGANVMSETTDGHTLTYDAFRVNPSAPGLHGITGDQEVDRILDLYRGPPIVAVPGSYTLFRG